MEVHRSGMAMETLWVYVLILSEEVQNLKDLQGGNWKQRCSNSGTCGTIRGSWIQENLKLRLVELA